MRIRKTETATAELTSLVVCVTKELRADSHIVLKAELPTLSEVCKASERRMILDERRADLFLSQAQARANVWRSALGKAWVSLGRIPFAHLPVAEAIAKTAAMNGDWACETLARFDGIERGWIT